MAEDPDPPSRSPSRKHADDIFNRWLDQLTNGAHALAIAVVVGGVFRYVLDVDEIASASRMLVTLSVGLALEGLSLYIMRWRRPED